MLIMDNNVKLIYSDEGLPTKVVVWDLGRRCNHDCTYCTAFMHSTTAPFNSFEQYKKTAEFIDEYYSIYSMYHKADWRVVVSFTGGEPAINPAFFKLVPWLRENYPYMELNLTTNGTWGERRGQFLLDNLDSITVSYHCEGTDKQRALARKNMLWVRENIPNKNKLKVNVMMHMDHFDEAVDLIENYLKPNDINYIPRVLGDDEFNSTEWVEDTDGAMRRTSHTYTAKQQDYLKNHWKAKNERVGDTISLVETSKDGLAAKMGRMCCGGRCMTVKSEDGNKERNTMFINQSNFKDWSCMVNWFFLHIEEDNDAVYHHQTCRAKIPGSPKYDFPKLGSHQHLNAETTGPICTISDSGRYLEWLENHFVEDGPPVIKSCPNVHCGCGVCVPKARDKDDFDQLVNKYIIGYK
jgi:MoaA/NifB/PqqE/SkfB family radical SAM enzyme